MVQTPFSSSDAQPTKDETDRTSPGRHRSKWRQALGRDAYVGSFLINLVGALLPALYMTLNQLWVANFDGKQQATTMVYQYLGVISEVLKDGIPRVSWLVLTDGSTRSHASRLELTFVMVAVQVLLGAGLTVALIAAAPKLAQTFVPADTWALSVNYVRLNAPVALTSVTQAAISSATRALDLPDVSLVINASCTLLNIALDFLLISEFHIGWITPSITAQASIRLACNLLATLIGLAYFLWSIRGQLGPLKAAVRRGWSPQPALAVLLDPARWTVLESLIRNAIYLWALSRIIALGHDYALAVGLFEGTIRWGLIMAPAGAFYASGLTFVGHRWAAWRFAKGNAGESNPCARWADVWNIVEPAIWSAAGAFAVEVFLCAFMTAWGIERFAYFLTKSADVTGIVTTFWRNVEGCYVIFAIGYQASAVLLAISPHYFLVVTILVNLLWVMPWAIALTVLRWSAVEMWTLGTIMLGGAVTLTALVTGAVLFAWYWRLEHRQLHAAPVSEELRSLGSE